MKYKFLFFFFFQAEDGIRDWSVTGVQTCALPISITEHVHLFSDSAGRPINHIWQLSYFFLSAIVLPDRKSVV